MDQEVWAKVLALWDHSTYLDLLALSMEVCLLNSILVAWEDLEDWEAWGSLVWEVLRALGVWDLVEWVLSMALEVWGRWDLNKAPEVWAHSKAFLVAWVLEEWVISLVLANKDREVWDLNRMA